MICGDCGAENRPERKFCLRCGTPLASRCPNCGASNEPEAAFCGECGTRLGGATAAARIGESDRRPALAPESTAERRLVSVLFADLVGFTAAAEGLDAEDTRALLDRYFASAREIVERYGGTIEKFIGDAVMAVWGTPTAHEDDAERAVRAALDLVAAVPRLADGGLTARAGVLTGEAAVSIGAVGQGMVAGDLVNTASRLQSVAEPGTVLVGESTMRAAAGAITFEGAGEHVLKGRLAPVPAWQALAVVGLVRGVMRSDLLEPPFVGRDAEFDVLKERLHATSRDRRARLVSITGVAGIGKSRLAWELEKYIDGVVEAVYWHHGRSPAYGDGIAFWALGEMVRRRAGIAERDDAVTTDEKLAATVSEFVADEGERRWVLARLRALLGLEDAPDERRDELFAAWRRFFEGVAEHGTTVLVFEDLQWADEGQVDFIRSLMEWSRQSPILIVTLARPELFERHPTWGAGQRDFTSLHLDPLPAEAMTTLVEGLAPGLPAGLARTIVERAEGVPLYAVELFRMLLDRGRVTRTEGGYLVVGEAELEVPETLQSLVAARLDVLPPAERRLLQDAAVLGQTFPVDALAAVSDEPVEVVEAGLRALVRRELLTIDADPRSPERGQYGFVGAFMREVAYGTLARRDRRARHLAAARFFESVGDDELAGVLASHYLAAHAASQPGPEAEAVAVQARLALRGAAERALGVASPEAAVTYLRQALEVTTEADEVARLQEDIARIAQRGAIWPVAEEFAAAALQSATNLGDAPAVARVSSIRGTILFFQGRIEPAVEMLNRALRGLEGTEPALELTLHRQLARAELFRARPTEALRYIESGLTLAARLDDLDGIGDLLISRAWAVSLLGRYREGMIEYRGVLEFGRANGLRGVYLRAVNNLSTVLLDEDPAEAVRIADAAMEFAERTGDRDSMAKLAFVAIAKTWAGDWAGAQALIDRWGHDDAPNLDWLTLAGARCTMAAWSGRFAEAESLLQDMRDRVAGSDSAQDQFATAATEYDIARARGDADGLRRTAAVFADADRALGSSGWEGAGVAGLVAAREGDLVEARARLEQVSAMRPQFAAAAALLRVLEGSILAREGRPREAAAAYREGIALQRRIGMVLQGLVSGLDAVETLGPEDPIVAEVEGEIAAFIDRTGAVLFRQRFDAALERARGRPASSASTHALAAPAGAAPAAGAPQNVRTTS